MDESLFHGAFEVDHGLPENGHTQGREGNQGEPPKALNGIAVEAQNGPCRENRFVEFSGLGRISVRIRLDLLETASSIGGGRGSNQRVHAFIRVSAPCGVRTDYRDRLKGGPQVW